MQVQKMQKNAKKCKKNAKKNATMVIGTREPCHVIPAPILAPITTSIPAPIPARIPARIPKIVAMRDQQRNM